ncbi:MULTISPECIES: hypothetical protein [unclassified Oceanispirochaeta]|uniref:hypothetical protein n=1 Tax=unclassified Oceanispirochaeta TaxID=2635722 RepID=UPI000E09750B|nr:MULTISPECIES: hypothetical protein [unclassified Oceanispirochaeta]MBF9018751.1 hypothetical protein [Oceanispirochaeta sp. M2]NPD75189.1 hypothetical protein [Oceanispirochaeta sp. M1]RDG28972.1 hypothetical protein DV872_24140 [Oceanispirochaeta sp. M1]
MEIILIPEEEIYLALYTALSETFPKLVEQCNAARGANWIKPFASILDTGESFDLKPLPLVELKLEEVKRKSSDPFVEQCTYLLTLNCRFERSSPTHTAYRYAYLLKELLKSDDRLKGLVDRFLLEECIYSPLIPQDGMGYPEVEYKIILYRDEIK